MKQIVLSLAFYLVLIIVSACQGVKDNSLIMLVGTYTGDASKGIYVYKFNTESLTATLLSETETPNPSYLVISPDTKYVYAVSESGDNSSVSSFGFDKDKSNLHFKNKVKVPADPCYIEIDHKQRFVATADYSGGSVSFIPIAADGSLINAVDIHSFSGNGVDSVRQTKPHLHCVTISPDNHMAFATDLGTDHIYSIRLEPDKKDSDISYFNHDSWSETELEGRSGPRHFVFNKMGTRAYLLNEISGKVTVFSVDAENHLEEIQSVVADTCYAEGSADIHLSPDENYLYASTRLKGDGIVIFKVDADGMIERRGYHATGKHPRNFAITPDGNLMLVACRDGGMIQIFRIDKQTGMLTDTGKCISLEWPVCIKFAG